MVKTAFEMLDAREDEAEEPKEAPVEAVPRLTRDVFGYHEPRPGIDGKQYHGQCANCARFVPEAAMTGAMAGARCALFGSSFSVSDDDSCGHFSPWNSGIPCESVILFNAGELRKGMPPAISPWMAGYKARECTQCGKCKFGDATNPEMPAGKMECELFEEINTRSPNVFSLETIVDVYAGCSLWRPVDNIIPSGGSAHKNMS
jgi:hypothetical protein